MPMRSKNPRFNVAVQAAGPTGATAAAGLKDNVVAVSKVLVPLRCEIGLELK